ncbi:DUF742 domain-containing protein [Streptomonospora nanhaiensis]|uniref:DNA-binding transcriptional ArsR family regulator n=1 Tax=Streptomonospora nanhaiensis TaxID=1323731 RepID=A0A853BJH9_9ACTN|nr:DUF742 domain-containing protein [Streptomonospora nanhaiensis]MBV2363298.1 DUF742 domain-containing protein [Streptomonospora nanhaiensis]MBX9390899.1 DUF742 domain-containing protein [Streptomonospora nanhaiensis]NYI95658.1 DNA-binding transcriptional ArsR family regulator [Streptomonospora nanhaiensis]
MTLSRTGQESPERLFTLTAGRVGTAERSLDGATLIVSTGDAAPGTPSEHVRILRLCRVPTPVGELAARLGLPVSVVTALLGDLLATGRVTARRPSPGGCFRSPPRETLEQVLHALQRL